MLELTGVLSGEFVEEKLVSPAQVIKLFKLPLSRDKKVIRFELDASSQGVIGINQADGSTKHAIKHLFQPIVQGNYDGESYSIRYYTSKNPSKIAGRYNYNPKRIEYAGKQKGVNLETEMELAIMLLLNPKCKDSPFHQTGRMQSKYKISDALKRAKQDMADNQTRADLRDQILNSPEDFIIRVAKGMALTQKNVRMEDTDNPIIARSILLTLAEKNPTVVAAAFVAKEIQVAGVVADAYGKGLIVQKQIAGGLTRWSYCEALGSAAIVDCPAKSNIQQWLIDHLINPNHLATFMKTVYKTEDVKVVTEAKVVKTENTGADVAKEAIEKGILTFDPVESKVYIMENGFQQDRAFMVIKNGQEQWKDELYERIIDRQVKQLQALMEA